MSSGVCLLRPRTPSVPAEAAEPPARPLRSPLCALLLQFLSLRQELRATASGGGGKPVWQPPILGSRAGKIGSAYATTYRSNWEKEDSVVTFVGRAETPFHVLTRMAEWLRRWT